MKNSLKGIEKIPGGKKLIEMINTSTWLINEHWIKSIYLSMYEQYNTVQYNTVQLKELAIDINN